MLRARKMTAPCLTAAAMLAVLSGVAGAEQNVALHRPYICTSGVMEGWTGLVDGVADSDSGPGCFATTNDSQFPKTVTIDLERPCIINRITVHNSTNGNTRGIAIYCSEDGEQFEKLREFIFPQGQALTLNHRFQDRPAQFVRIEFANTWGGGLGGDNVIFAREVEVFGEPSGDAPILLPAPQPTGDPLVSTRELRLFRRWALNGSAPLTVVTFGDSLMEWEEESWVQVVAERLRATRPEGAQVSVIPVAHAGMTPDAGSGAVTDVIDAAPDLVLVSFGTDMVRWDPESFRSGLAAVLQRLLADTDALVVLVGPVSGDAETVDIARRALREMEGVADLLGLPLLRTEATLLAAGLTGADVTDGEGGLSSEARMLIATSLVDLLVGRTETGVR